MQTDPELKKVRNKKYYHLAHLGSKDLAHPAMIELIKLCRKSKNILDLGCGDGTRVNGLREVVNNKEIKWTGIDLSEYAIKKAKKNYPAINFLVGDLEKLPFKENQFDLLYSAFVFEHINNPEKILEEAKRVLKIKGKFLIVAPNFGSPNRRSPNSKKSKIDKLLTGFFIDLFGNSRDKINWEKVEPQKNKYEIDSDTTIEPYVLSFKKYAANAGFKIDYYSSLWEKDNFSLFQVIFRVLGKFSIYPFKYWGPHMLIILEKK